MDTPYIDRLVNALLYEGYLLYPYCPAVKNTRRWTFGGLYPRAWSKLLRETEPFQFETQFVVVGDMSSRLRISVRFLHLMEHALDCCNVRPDLLACDSGQGTAISSWQEAVERRVDPETVNVNEILNTPFLEPFAIAGDAVALNDDAIGARDSSTNWRQAALEGTVLVSARQVDGDAFRISIRITNETPLLRELQRDQSDDAKSGGTLANEALLRSFASTHAILRLVDGEFVSLIDPPEERLSAVQQCSNNKLWPILVGEQGARDTLLCSPIILFDYPQIAAESPGDLFDATEIDEILTLRILTLTEDEKRQICALDERGRALLARTHALAERRLADLHGTVRSFSHVEEPSGVE